MRDDFVVEHADGHSGVPAYCGVRTAEGWIFVEYTTNEEELYDTGKDPLEGTNLASADPGMVASLKTEARALCSPTPPGFSW